MNNRFTIALIKARLVAEKNFENEILPQIRESIEKPDCGLKIYKEEYFDFSKKDQEKLSLAEKFYAIHKEKDFFDELIQSTQGRVFVMIIEARNKHMNPIDIWRKMFGKNVNFNDFHGSDSEQNAIREAEILWPNITAEYKRKKIREIQEFFPGMFH